MPGAARSPRAAAAAQGQAGMGRPRDLRRRRRADRRAPCTSASTARRSRPFTCSTATASSCCRAAGITPVVITGRDSPAVRPRSPTWAARHARYGTQDKRPPPSRRWPPLGVGWRGRRPSATTGPTCRCCTAPPSPAPAPTPMPRCGGGDHVTAAPGGQGAAREFCDLLLVASGRYASLLQARRWTPLAPRALSMGPIELTRSDPDGPGCCR